MYRSCEFIEAKYRSTSEFSLLRHLTIKTFGLGLSDLTILQSILIDIFLNNTTKYINIMTKSYYFTFNIKRIIWLFR